MLKSAAASIGHDLSLTAAELETALSPENFVNVRGIYGGPSPEETRRALEEQEILQADDEAWREQAAERLADARKMLEAAASP